MRISVSALISPVFASRWAVPILFFVLIFAAHNSEAQSLGYEGPTGIFVTPLAATSASPAHGAGHPSIAYHVLAGGPVIGTFNTVSFTEGFAKRFELGYTREDHAAGNTTGLSPLWTDGLNLFHAKAVVVPENAGKTKWVPAIAVGGIARTNDSYVGDGSGGQARTNGDFYLVATKIVTQTKKVPLLLNAGVRGTNASLWGLGGNAPDFQARAFGALGFVFTGPGKSAIIFASEAAQQPQRIKVTSAGVASSAFDIPTSIDYAVRVVPSPKHKLNIDAGILQAAGRIAPGVDLKARARFAFGISYGF
ncbi:MAG: DUF3034 family protein [Terracidiphilus sp.]|nr:DUF3034 family protein [Terracidiphilus sp.]